MKETHTTLNVTYENLAMNVRTSYPQKFQNKSNSGRKLMDGSIMCDYCHMSGHPKDKCYCVHEYPSWHKLFEKPKPKPKFLSTRNSVVASVIQGKSAFEMSTNVMSSADYVSSGVQSSTNVPTNGLSLCDIQCQQLIQMLQQNLTANQNNAVNSGDSGVSGVWPPYHSINTVQIT